MFVALSHLLCSRYISILTSSTSGPTEFGERHLNLAHDLKALRNLVQALMQGYENDPPKIDDRSRWGEGCLMFFDTLITAESLDELLKVGEANINTKMSIHVLTPTAPLSQQLSASPAGRVSTVRAILELLEPGRSVIIGNERAPEHTTKMKGRWRHHSAT
ncbi:hypothetical protein FDECE_100 [Fusarium decemcellulare]|nr:hypothetical protein FDECE_100 [Fusarium decemcellulare]